MRFLQEHELMRTMGWTRAQLQSHSSLEIQAHLAVLEYKAAKRQKNELQMQHELELARRGR